MSISVDLERLNNAKESLKASLELRGASVGDGTIDTFSPKLDSCPFAVNGTFTPQEDTGTFSISGLRFTPDSFSVYCSELFESSVNSAVDTAVIIKGENSFVRYRGSDGVVAFANIPATSSVLSWSDDGCSVSIPSPEKRGYFKAGYTYGYKVTGGMKQ